MATLDADDLTAITSIVNSAVAGIGTAGGAAVNIDAIDDNWANGVQTALAGVLLNGVLTPASNPGWTVSELVGKSIRLGTTNWYTISANTGTTVTIISPPANGNYDWRLNILPGVLNTTNPNASTVIGTQGGTRFTDTSYVNGVYHSITNVSTEIDIVYKFNCGGGTTPVSVVWTGYLANNSTKSITAAVWNHVGNNWQTLGIITGQTGTTNVVKNFVLYPRHIGTSVTEIGNVYIKFYCSGMSSTVLHTDQIYVSYAITSRSIGYSDGAIWIDTATGVDGAVPFVNGTADNPVGSYENAESLETQTGIRRFHVKNGTTVTVTGPGYDLIDHTFLGSGWNLVLVNGVDISGLHVEGANVSGIATGTTPASFFMCNIGDATLPESYFTQCSFSGTLTTITHHDYTLHHCYDANPSTATQPIIEFTGNNNIGLRNWCGGIELASMASTDYLTADGAGRCVIGSSCADGRITIRGPWAETTDNVVGGFAGTIVVTEQLSNNETTLTAIESDITDIKNTVGSGSVAGPGATSRTITITANGNPVVGVGVWITTDLAGTNVVGGTVYTNDSGVVNLLVDVGTTYYVWCDSAEADFVSPVEWVA